MNSDTEIKIKNKKLVFIYQAGYEPTDADQKDKKNDQKNNFINLSLFDLSRMLQCKAVSNLIIITFNKF
jgi:hypothetical protein